MNALDLLIADHNQVRGLFSRFQEAMERDETDAAAVLATRIAEELEVHTAIEEEIFYPTVHDLDGETGEAVDEGIEEHHVVDRLLAEIKTLDPSSDQWRAKTTVLIENVEHHADEEETELFPHVRGLMSATDLETLGERLEAAKADKGAPTAADNADATVEQLRSRASDQEIPGRSTMDRDDLAATVRPD